jgi:hypothetical protein
MIQKRLWVALIIFGIILLVLLASFIGISPLGLGPRDTSSSIELDDTNSFVVIERKYQRDEILGKYTMIPKGQDYDRLGHATCNPSIGVTAKTQYKIEDVELTGWGDNTGNMNNHFLSWMISGSGYYGVVKDEVKKRWESFCTPPGYERIDMISQLETKFSKDPKHCYDQPPEECSKNVATSCTVSSLKTGSIFGVQLYKVVVTIKEDITCDFE